MVSKYESSDDEMLRAFSVLTVRAAKLEEDLRDVFCCLVGSLGDEWLRVESGQDGSITAGRS
jgi:hypothetical protein